MAKIAVVTDTNSGITAAEAEKHGISLIPMPFMVNGKEYFEGVSCTYEHFFELLDQGADVSTSMPSAYSITSVWEKLLNTYDGVVYLPMSSALSGSCQAAKALAREYGGKVYVADNKRISITLRQSVFDALSMAEQGMELEDIGRKLEETGLDCSIYLAVNTLELLKKSGRVTAAGAAIATVLGLKPVLQIQGEKLDAFAKARGMKAAEKVMFNAIDKDLAERFAGRNVKVAAAYSGSDENGREWLKLVKKHFGARHIEIYRLPISICCHVGGGVRAMGCIPIME